MRNKIIFLIFAILVACCSCNKSSSVKEIYSLEEMGTIPAGAIIFFDVDDTLISSSDVFARGGHMPLLFKWRIWFTYPEIRERENWERLYSLVWTKAPRILIEPKSPQKIKELQERGHMVLGLTSIPTGSLGVIKDVPLWRFEMLKKMGILFSTDFPNHIFNQLPPHKNNYPKLYNGIICTNSVPKGKVVGAFLDTFKLNPAALVLFDDSSKNLRSLEDLCKTRNIPCLLFHYKGAQKLPGKWNTKQALKQLDALIEKEEWVGDHAYAN